MRLKDLSTPLWLLVLLLGLEAGLELRAHLRGWETLLLGPGPIQRAEAAGDVSYGPRADYPFWGPVHGQARSPGTLRIWVASTSHAAPMDVPKSRIFPTLMERECRAAGRRCEVLNASEPGLLVEENIATLEALAPAWRPDVAVLYQMANDVSALSGEYLGAQDPSAHERPAEAPEPLLPSWPARTGERTTTWVLVKTNLTSRLVPSRVLADGLGAAGEARFLTAVERFVVRARALGIEPVLVTFAVSHRADQLQQMPEPWQYYVYSFNMHLSIAGWMQTVRELNQGLYAMASRLDVPIIDLDGPIGGQSALFSDFHHFKWEGHERVAQVLTMALLQEREAKR